MAESVVLETNLSGLRKVKAGKVRDIYAVDDDRLLIVATDRISAFDWVLPTGIPGKGRVLTALTLFWLDYLKPRNHLITAEVEEMPGVVRAHAETLRGRSMLVKKAEVFPVECVARGYLAGSGWKEYRESQTVCGISLPPGLRESERLPRTLFTPATKAESGHDENIGFDRVVEMVGPEHAEALRANTVAIYERAAAYAEERGIILCDTKLEWGLCDGEMILVDELLTPDSSRFWPREGYEPGRPQPSFDKQFVRDWLTASGWDRNSPPPELPPDVVEKTSEKYRRAYEILAGRSIE